MCPYVIIRRIISKRDGINRFLPAATKLGQGNVFTGVCDSVHRGGVCLSACWDTPPPPGADTPSQEQTPLGADTPQEQTPLGAETPPGTDTPLEQTPSGSRPPSIRYTTRDQVSPPEADSGIRSTSRRYASYWNAFLLWYISHQVIVVWECTTLPGHVDLNSVIQFKLTFKFDLYTFVFLISCKTNNCSTLSYLEQWCTNSFWSQILCFYTRFYWIFVGDCIKSCKIS